MTDSPTAPTAAALPAPGRLLSLDVFRGMAIAGMVLVNNPGTWSAIYAPLKHAEWHGWTPTDLVFPFFLFIVGVSITLSLAKRAAQGGSRGALVLGILRRAAIIFLLGMLLNGFPYFNLSTIRIPGVLQRIAICYAVAAILFLFTTLRTQVIVAALLLVGYWLVMTLVPVPGYGRGDLSTDGNLAAHVDRTLLVGHIYKPTYDPEGLLSTLPAVVTVLAGIFTGHWLRSGRGGMEKSVGLFVAGAACVTAGWFWGLGFPVNKPLWTSSYVLFTAGMALQLLGLCYWLIEVRGIRRWSKPFEIYGMNAITVFVLSGLVGRTLTLIKFDRGDGTPTTLRQWLYEAPFASWMSPKNASLLYAVCYVLIWLGLMTLLYRKRIFIKV